MSSFTLESNSFDNDGIIPKKFGYKNGNVSPSLKISHIPENTKSLALIMDDPDAMQAVGKIWVHWILYNILPNSVFEENEIPSECIEGKTDFDEIGYGGPAPPDREHTYIFKLYALDNILNSENSLSKEELEKLMDGHILSQTTLKGRYSPQ